MDIRSGCGWPGTALSNFAGHKFVFDGIECASMEGFLQSLKFDKPHIQVEVCKLIGKAAKFRGKKRNKAWQSVQRLWWNGKELDRHSPEYYRFIRSAYLAMAKQSESFKKALLATGEAVLTHSIGHNNPHQTILTEAEFVGILHWIRQVVKSGNLDSVVQ